MLRTTVTILTLALANRREHRDVQRDRIRASSAAPISRSGANSLDNREHSERGNWLVMAIGSDLEQWRSRAKSFETLWRASSCDGKREIAPQLLPAFGNHR